MARPTARLLLMLTATLVSCAACGAQGTYDRQISAPPGGQLRLQTDVGSVTLTGQNTPEVLVHAQLHGSKSFLQRVHISTRRTATGIAITVHEDHRGWFHWFDSASHSVQLTVEVPTDYPVEVHTAGGNASVGDLDAGARVTTAGGSARVRNVTGALTVSSAGGSVEVSGLKGPAHLQASGGSIRVSDATGDLDLTSSGGAIFLNAVQGKVQAHSAGGSIRAQMLSNLGMHLSSAGGDINLLLPRDTHATIDAAASGGHVSCAFPASSTEVSAASRFRGTIGGGGAPIVLHSAGGDIRVTAAN
ncbi:MAG: DUF4097 family beta strand repeat-containing protein [Steroidobacteraceae bacterium]